MVTILSLLFFLSELLLFLFKKSKSGETAIRQDKNSVRILWLTIITAMFSAVLIANKFPGGWGTGYFQWPGIVFFIIGAFIRWSAIYQLGKSFTVDVSISKNHKIMNTGLYKTIRHPSYLGLLMEFFGISLLFSSWYSVVIINVPIFIALNYRINIEEKLLTDYFGEEYEQYKKRTKRLVPFIY